MKLRLTELEQCRLILRAASWIVPARARAEWRREWEAELTCKWRVSRGKGLSPLSPGSGLRRRCFGAFLDAAWYRLNREDLERTRQVWSQTPGFVLFTLISVLLLLISGSGYLPRMRSILLPPPYADPQPMATVSGTGIINSAEWMVPYSWVKIWRSQSHAVEGVAAYSARPRKSVLTIGARRSEIESVQVEPSLLQVFAVKPRLGRTSPPDAANCSACVVLSYEAWRRSFAGDPNIVQEKAVIDGQEAVVFGVLPERFWFPSEDVGVLQLRGENALSANQQVGVVARLRPGVSESRAEWELQRSIENAIGEPFSGSAIEVWRLQDRVRQPLLSYASALGISLLVMTTVLCTGRLNLLPQRRGAGAACRWWIFFATKTCLLLLLLLAAVVEFTPEPYIFPRGRATLILESASLWIFSVGCVFALWWSLMDQQGRCRACLRKLALPARIGTSGSMLLSWAGTELVCAQGHGLLHVTETDVCWLDPSQWTQLDESWKSLFYDKPESEVASSSC